MNTCHNDQCREPDASPTAPAPAELGALLCRHCLTAAQADTRRLVTDYLDLEQALPAGVGDTTAGTRVTGTHTAAAPIHLGVDAHQRAIHHTVTLWETVLRDVDRLANPAENVRHGYAVAAAVAVIAPRVALLSTLDGVDAFHDGPDGDIDTRTGLEAIATLRALHRRSRAILGHTRRVEQLPGDCSGCGLAALTRTVGVDRTDTVHCDGCGRAWTYNDYIRYVGMVLQTTG